MSGRLFPRWKTETFSTEISSPFPRGAESRKASPQQGGRRFYTHSTAPTATTVFLYSSLFCFRRRTVRRMCKTSRAKSGGRSSEKTGSFPRCFRSFFLPVRQAAHAEITAAYPAGRPKDADASARPFGTVSPVGQPDVYRPSVRRSLRAAKPKRRRKPHLVFLTPSVLRFPLRADGGREKHTPKTSLVCIPWRIFDQMGNEFWRFHRKNF